MKEYIPAGAAARILGLNTATIRRKMKSKELSGQIFGEGNAKRYYVSVRDVIKNMPLAKTKDRKTLKILGATREELLTTV